MLTFTPKDIIQFWFVETPNSTWWKKDHDFDALIAKKFLELHRQASQCELSSWRQDALGCLAEIIILDQFSRNIFRDTTKAFEFDSLALALAQNTVLSGQDKSLSDIQRSFLYMPYMHSESVMIHRQAVDLFSELGNKASLDFELKHKVIIDRFGRYPHRNAILGRVSTESEIDFLSEPGSAF